MKYNYNITSLEETSKYLRRKIRTTRIVIYTLFLWFIFSIIYIVSLKHDIIILQDYNDSIETVDYFGPQD